MIVEKLIFQFQPEILHGIIDSQSFAYTTDHQMYPIFLQFIRLQQSGELLVTTKLNKITLIHCRHPLQSTNIYIGRCYMRMLVAMNDILYEL